MSDPARVLNYAPPPRSLPWRRIGIVVIVFLIYGAIGGVLGALIAPKPGYLATGILSWNGWNADGSAVAAFYAALQKQMAEMRSPESLAKVSATLKTQGVNVDPPTLAGSLKLETPKGTNLITVSFSDRDPNVARVVPNAVMQVAAEQASAVADPPSPIGEPIRPANPIVIVNTGLGGAFPIPSPRIAFASAGVVAGLAVAVLVLLYQRTRRVKA